MTYHWKRPDGRVACRPLGGTSPRTAATVAVTDPAAVTCKRCMGSALWASARTAQLKAETPTPVLTTEAVVAALDAIVDALADVRDGNGYGGIGWNTVQRLRDSVDRVRASLPDTTPTAT